jgi:hypothetical protein
MEPGAAHGLLPLRVLQAWLMACWWHQHQFRMPALAASY